MKARTYGFLDGDDHIDGRERPGSGLVDGGDAELVALAVLQVAHGEPVSRTHRH